MQIFYVLVSNPIDYFYEQFLLSVTSLKVFMPNAEAILICDTKTNETLTGNRAAHQHLVSRTVSVEPPIDMSPMEVSRWLKTSMRRLSPGDFLYIDCDTVIADNLSSIFESGIKLEDYLRQRRFSL